MSARGEREASHTRTTPTPELPLPRLLHAPRSLRSFRSACLLSSLAPLFPPYSRSRRWRHLFRSRPTKSASTPLAMETTTATSGSHVPATTARTSATSTTTRTGPSRARTRRNTFKYRTGSILSVSTVPSRPRRQRDVWERLRVVSPVAIHAWLYARVCSERWAIPFRAHRSRVTRH